MKRTGKNLKSKFEEVQFQWRRNIAPNIGEKCNLIEEVLPTIKRERIAKQDQTDKGYKIRPIINQLNKSFQESYSNEPKQTIHEHMTKFKGRSSMRQYLKMKPIKWGF